MNQIEKFYYEWASKDSEPEELVQKYEKNLKILSYISNHKKAIEINMLYMDCVRIERIEAFKAGFQYATALWKEC